MRLRALHPLLVPLCCGILSIASPGITSKPAGPNTTPEALERNQDGIYNYTTAEHSISIADFSAKDNKKNIVIEDVLHLKLQCSLVVASKDLQIGVSWRRNNQPISSNLYTYNNTDNLLHTTYEFVVTDTNKTGDYACVFRSGAEVNGTFHVQAPPIHGGSKALVSYYGDFIVVKCDTSTYIPQKWTWYKIIDNEQVELNISLDSQKYEELSNKLNETKLQITNLSEGDNGGYVCKATFKNVETEAQVHIKVLSYMVPLKVFLVIAAEVAILVAVILVYEVISKKKQGQEDVKKDYEPMAQLKSEDSNIGEASTARQRKV
ncbi:embigin [Engystomops pustulosus]|uniref:embigin n=1 Tax=Engystomops pustulosus TaxID=76066 RepID=UPI003AFB3B25